MAMTSEERTAEIARLTTELTEVRAARKRARLAASYSVSGRSHTNQAIAELRIEEREIMSRLARLRSTGPLVLVDANTDGVY
jgi:hypothetical protein